MDRLDRAIEELFDEDSPLTFDERFSNLRMAYMWNAGQAMKKIQKRGKKDPISEDEEYKQIEGMKQFKNLERMYMSELKANKIQGKSSQELDKVWLQKIKEEKGAIGEIVRDLKAINN